MNIYTALLTLLITFSSYSETNIRTTTYDEIANKVNDLATSSNNKTIAKHGRHNAKYILSIANKLSESANFKITNFTSKSKTNFTIEWQLSKTDIIRMMSKRLPLWEGEAPKTTSSTYGSGNQKRNKLYFFEKPLGQNNGLTFYFKKNSLNNFYKEIMSKYKAFIEVTTPTNQTYIPIISTTEKSGCGSDIWSQNPTLLCYQTSHPQNNEMTIGQSQGFTNNITTNDTNINEEDITIRIVQYYNGELIL